MASLLASVVRTSGFVKSGYCSNASVISNFFRVTKAWLVIRKEICVLFQ